MAVTPISSTPIFRDSLDVTIVTWADFLYAVQISGGGRTLDTQEIWGDGSLVQARFNIDLSGGESVNVTLLEDYSIYVREESEAQAIYVELDDVTLSNIPDNCADGESEEQWFNPGDDPINTQVYATFAAYCEADNSEVVIYNVDTVNGKGSAVITFALADLPVDLPESNVLLASGGVNLYYLMIGALMAIGAPAADTKAYALAWDSCPAGYAQAYIRTTPC
jgi:hypothetical protein